MAAELLALGIGVIFLILLLIALAVAAFVFWIIMIIDCAKRNFKGDSEKIVWILVLIFLGIIGALIYYFVVPRNDKSKSKKK